MRKCIYFVSKNHIPFSPNIFGNHQLLSLCMHILKSMKMKKCVDFDVNKSRVFQLFFLISIIVVQIIPFFILWLCLLLFHFHKSTNRKLCHCIKFSWLCFLKSLCIYTILFVIHCPSCICVCSKLCEFSPFREVWNCALFKLFVFKFFY